MKSTNLLAIIALLFLYACEPYLLDNNISIDGLVPRLNIRLTDGPIDLDEVNIDLQQVKIKGPKGFEEIPLGTNAGIYNLLDFQNGLDTLIASIDGLPFTEVKEIRLILGENNTVVADGVIHDLKVPSGSQSGLKIKVCLDLSNEQEVYDLLLDFDACASIHQTGNGKYIMKPVIRIMNPDAKCSGDENDYEEEEEEEEEDGGFTPTDDIPQEVNDFLIENYAGFDFGFLKTTFCDGTEVYLLQGKKGGQTILLYFDLDWNLLQSGKPFDEKNIPESVLNAIDTDYPDYKVMNNRAWELTRFNEDLWYRIYIKKNNSGNKIYVIYAADGTFICQED